MKRDYQIKYYQIKHYHLRHAKIQNPNKGPFETLFKKWRSCHWLRSNNNRERALVQVDILVENVRDLDEDIGLKKALNSTHWTEMENSLIEMVGPCHN